MRKRIFAAMAAVVLAGHFGSVAAATLTCPDMAQATQVGACPSEEELKYTFTGYCSDDNKAYRGETDVCTDFQLYRKMKNVALWESGDGVFDGYVPCGQGAQALRSAKPQSMQVFKQGKLTRLVCSYAQGQTFTFRTRAQCTVEAADCAAAGSTCRAACD